MTVANLEDLAKRVGRLEASDDIRALKSRYLAACDSKQLDVIKDCFLEGEIEIDAGPVGIFFNRNDFVAKYAELACNEYVMDLHLAGNPRIELLGEDNASGAWSLYFYQFNSETKTVIRMGCSYADTYRRVQGLWKISSSRCTTQVVEVLAMEDGVPRMKFAGRTLASLGQVLVM